MKILLHCSESPGSIGYDICFFINNPTARSITQRVLILLLITISVFLFCFNVYLVLPYLYPDKFTDNLPDSAKSFFRDNVAKARFDNLDEEHIRAIMQNMELDDNSVANKTKRFNELVEQEEDESEPMLEYRVVFKKNMKHLEILIFSEEVSEISRKIKKMGQFRSFLANSVNHCKI